jgi:hypothetical protein
MRSGVRALALGVALTATTCLSGCGSDSDSVASGSGGNVSSTVAEPAQADSVFAPGKRSDVGNEAGEIVGSFANDDIAAQREAARRQVLDMVGERRDVPQEQVDRLYEAAIVLHAIDVLDRDGELVGYYTDRFVELKKFEAIKSQAEVAVDEFDG